MASACGTLWENYLAPTKPTHAITKTSPQKKIRSRSQMFEARLRHLLSCQLGPASWFYDEFHVFSWGIGSCMASNYKWTPCSYGCWILLGAVKDKTPSVCYHHTKNFSTTVPSPITCVLELTCILSRDARKIVRLSAKVPPVAPRIVAPVIWWILPQHRKTQWRNRKCSPRL